MVMNNSGIYRGVDRSTWHELTSDPENLPLRWAWGYEIFSSIMTALLSHIAYPRPLYFLVLATTRWPRAWVGGATLFPLQISYGLSWLLCSLGRTEKCPV